MKKMAGYTEKGNKKWVTGNKSGQLASQNHLPVHMLSQPKRPQYESQHWQNLQSYTIIQYFSNVLISYDYHMRVIPPLLAPSPLQILFQATETTSRM